MAWRNSFSSVSLPSAINSTRPSVRLRTIPVMRENPYGGNSPGRLDYFLWPYLERDLDAALNFYCDKLGLKEQAEKLKFEIGVVEEYLPDPNREPEPATRSARV